MTFNKPSNLRRHVSRRHENERPFGCDVCDKKYSRKEDLRSHVRRHHGERQRGSEVEVERKKRKDWREREAAVHSESESSGAPTPKRTVKSRTMWTTEFAAKVEQDLLETRVTEVAAQLEREALFREAAPIEIQPTPTALNTPHHTPVGTPLRPSPAARTVLLGTSRPASPAVASTAFQAGDRPVRAATPTISAELGETEEEPVFVPEPAEEQMVSEDAIMHFGRALDSLRAVAEETAVQEGEFVVVRAAELARLRLATKMWKRTTEPHFNEKGELFMIVTTEYFGEEK